MKKKLYIWVLLCMVLLGCTDKSYRGSFDLNGTYYKNSRLPVWIKIGEPTDLLSKAGGESSIAGRRFHVYAFNKDAVSSYAVTNEEDKLNTLIDGTLDDAGVKAGREAYWDRGYERVLWADGLDVYWPQGDGVDYRYDFFAYYISNMKLESKDFKREKDKVSLNIEIDGMQDLMSAKASTPEEKFVALFPDEKERVYYQHYWCYSYDAAMMNINPEFIFKRHLVKLNFRLAAGVTEGASNMIHLKSLTASSKYKGEFVVAVRGESENVGLYFTNDKKDLELRESDGSPLADNYVIHTRESGTAPYTYKDMDGSLLVAPANAYKLNLSFEELKQGETKVTPYNYSVSIYRGGEKEYSEMFEPGNEYLVTFTVSGRMDISVDVTLAKWGPGGYVAPDTEGRPNNI